MNGRIDASESGRESRIAGAAKRQCFVAAQKGGLFARKHPTVRHGKDLVGTVGWGMVVDANTKGLQRDSLECRCVKRFFGCQYAAGWLRAGAVKVVITLRVMIPAPVPHAEREDYFA